MPDIRACRGLSTRRETLSRSEVSRHSQPALAPPPALTSRPPPPARSGRASTCPAEHGRDALTPRCAGRRVRLDERPVAQQRLDPRPLVLSRHARSQVSSGLTGGRLTAPRLREHGAPTTYPPARALPLRRTLLLDRRTRSRSSARTSAAGPSSGGIESGISTVSGIEPSGRKKCNGRVARSGRPARRAPSPLTPGQWCTRSTR